MTPGILDIYADRHADFGAVLEFEGLDLTGVALTIDVRRYPDAPGDPLLRLVGAPDANSEGLFLTGVSVEDGLTVSQVSLRINRATLEDQPTSSPLGGDYPASWDMIVQPFGGLRERILAGAFVIRAGVTR